MQMDSLEQIIQYHQDVKEHHQAATYKIWAYYHDPRVTKYESAPHNQQFKQAAAYIDMAITKVGTAGDEWNDRDMSIEWASRRDWSSLMAADLLYGVALELIVSAAHLKIDTRNYVSHMSKTDGDTPYIGESRTCLAEDLGRDIPYAHLKEIEATLDFAKMKRNNLAHFGHHYQGAADFSMLFVMLC